MTTEISSQLTNSKLPSILELNNNHNQNSDGDISLMDKRSFKRQIKRMSVSSASSSNSDTSEDCEVVTEESPVTTPEKELNINNKKEYGIKKYRSMSDGQVEKCIPREFTEIFPSLPDAVLQKLGLLGKGPREQINKEELEQKFITLALAFTTDAATIKDRCERQKRFRDQTEANLNTEIEKLVEKVTCIQPLCLDAETAELLTGLLVQIDVVIRASHHAATSAERFGAVQHEERLAEAVNLMINFVSLLKQQRDAVTEQLQKLENNTKLKESTAVNGKIITRRRASIATVSQLQDPGKSPPGGTSEIRRITRRTSDIGIRVSTVTRSSRSSRLELGVDLDKIKEGVAENGRVDLRDINQSNNDEESDQELTGCHSNVQSVEVDTSTLPLRQRIEYKCKQYVDSVHKKYNQSIEDGSLHNFFLFAALLCFVLGIIVLSNLLVEIEFSRLGHKKTNSLWNNVLLLLTNEEFENKQIKTYVLFSC